MKERADKSRKLYRYLYMVARQTTVLNRKAQEQDVKDARTERAAKKRVWAGLQLLGAVQGMDGSQAMGKSRRKGHKEIGWVNPNISLHAAMGF